MSKILLLTGMMVGFAYSMEFFIAWYSGNKYEADVFVYNRVMPPFVAKWMGLERYAPYWWAYWAMISCNVLSPQVFWFKSMRRSVPVIFVVSFLITIGMWFERFVIIVTSLHRAFLPGEWGMFYPTPVDILTFVGSCGTFLTLYMLFMRFLPQFAMSEIKNVTPQADPHAHHAHGTHEEGHGSHAGAGGTGWASPVGVHRDPGSVAKGGES
ncbi:MAG: hypothetical protein QM783_16650 [Phycisphaerales bacterium]